ncbi:hypothetical protein [Amycolatopsis sp. YIM 10]|uniref:hypothetical protein n=1 Tax=Amycolatopsis sp. YIM 10 TaxID=2653857 RepID=UPI001290015E|nr:hypothetical protein [Amycolatopsis sp. YIM 10]QFU92731.1 hypothetical protein YIM_37870 [Amycolatopsis sp. YIM 10]
MPEFDPSSRTLLVDGETFEVHHDPDQPGVHQLTWTTGPNAGYGFSIARSDHAEIGDAELIAQAREFLAGIDPATGFLSE